MDRLLAGYRRFRNGLYKEHEAVFRDLALRGQRPTKMIIGCSDARVDPAQTFDTGPGEVFMVRNVANLVPPYRPDSDFHGTSAAIEFAVRGLQVQNIVVLGHARCGGIAALMGAGALSQTDFIEPWMTIAAPARDRAREAAHKAGHTANSPEACALCEKEAVQVSISNLMSFPFVAQNVAAGSLAVHGWYFDITNGSLSHLNASGAFELIPPA